MNIEQNQHDDAIDKVLAALRDAAPPQDMEARILQRLAENPVPAHRPTLRDSIAAFSPTAAWWRGAITGAAFATFAICAVLLLQHRPQTPPHQTTAANNAAGPSSTTPQLTLAGQNRAAPCAHPTILRVETNLPTPTPQTLLAESLAPSHPAPELPLTAQERELAQLARTADPNQLATINLETQAKLQAQEAAEFEKFFAPPPTPPAKQNNE